MIIKVLHRHDGLEEAYECCSYFIQKKIREEQRDRFSDPDNTFLFTVFGCGREEPHEFPVNMKTHVVFIMNDRGQTIDKYHVPAY